MKNKRSWRIIKWIFPACIVSSVDGYLCENNDNQCNWFNWKWESVFLLFFLCCACCFSQFTWDNSTCARTIAYNRNNFSFCYFPTGENENSKATAAIRDFLCFLVFKDKHKNLLQEIKGKKDETICCLCFYLGNKNETTRKKNKILILNLNKNKKKRNKKMKKKGKWKTLGRCTKKNYHFSHAIIDIITVNTPNIFFVQTWDNFICSAINAWIHLMWLIHTYTRFVCHYEKWHWSCKKWFFSSSGKK